MVFVPTKLHFFYIGTRVCLILFPKKRKDELDTPSAGEKFSLTRGFQTLHVGTADATRGNDRRHTWE